MKTDTLGKFVLFALVFILAGSSIFYVALNQTSKKSAADVQSDKLFGWKFPVAKFPSTGPGSQIAYSNIRDPGGVPKGLPVRLKIPSISVDSAIEDAFITNDGRMDVPAGSINVAWFALGPHPGQIGSAVIGGHFGIQNNIPFVFYNLDKLKISDKVYVEDDNGNTLAFVVRDIKSFDRNGDSTTVFTSSDGIAHLNLITCEGVWNQVNGTYPLRLVVFTDAIPNEGPVTIHPKLPVTSVVVTPAPTIAPTPTPTPSTAIVIANIDIKEKLSDSVQSVTPYAKELFKTPLDTTVTSLILTSILLVIFLIIAA